MQIVFFISCVYSLLVDLDAECKVEEWSAYLLTRYYWHNQPLKKKKPTKNPPKNNVHFHVREKEKGISKKSLQVLTNLQSDP